MTHPDLPTLLARLEAAGVELTLHLDVIGPDDALTDHLVEVIRAHKPLLLSHLARQALWAELSSWRWGPALNAPEPGIDSRGPTDPADLARRLVDAGADSDLYAIAEREAIRADGPG